MGRKVIALWLFLVMLFGFVVIVDLTLNLTTNVGGATLYVNTTGLGGAYTSIQDAIDNASAGDTVFVYQGNYNENIIINKTLNMKGENRDSTWIKGDGTGDVVFVSANWVNITGFTITKGGSSFENAGIKLIDNKNCKIYYNCILNNDYYGIYLYNSSWNEILDNSAHNNYRDCINLKFSRGNNIANNTLYSTEGTGIMAYYSDETIIQSNSAWDHWGSIYLLRSNQSSVINNSVSNGIYGIRGDFCFKNNYTDNTAFNNEYAFNIENSEENNILNNTVKSNNKNGIKLFQTTKTNISTNDVSNSGIGIYLHTTYGPNIVTENTISSNEYGIELYHSGNNWIYHNNFIDNINQGRIVGHGTNYLDNGYPSGGNYWSDYEGTDEFHGPDQNIFGGDGIGDSHHVVYYESKDNYPLMREYFIDDSKAPEIQLLSPINNSTIKAGVILDFDVYDENLFTTNYSINGEVDIPLYDPFNISTDSWSNGGYTVWIQAQDFAGNQNTSEFYFIIDTVSPFVISTELIDHSINASINATLTITFSEPMNHINVENFLSLSPSVSFSLSWDLTGTKIIMSFANNNLREGTTYTLIVDSNMTDLVGNQMDMDFVFVFTTVELDFDNDGVYDSEDADDDNDGYLDEEDAFPYDATEWLDTDKDGIGNNADSDDDNDEVPDDKDDFPLDPNKWKKESKENFTLYILLIFIIVIVSLILTLLFLRRKKTKSEPTEEELEELPPPQ
jgi:parallel beta-helix repeat protein